MKIYNRQYNQQNTGTRLGSSSRGAITVGKDTLPEKQVQRISDEQEGNDDAA